ncbi:MAG: nicotinate phosphoribosyltransferase [Bacteroidota bacterium]
MSNRKLLPMFHRASDEEIKQGKVTDLYFVRTVEILKAKKLNKHVRAEFVVKKFPGGYHWGIFAGLEEACAVLKDLPVGVRAMEEGTIFYAHEPVLEIEGKYIDFAVFETALLGFVCQASGIATKAARIRIVAGNRVVTHFGARRMHPVISPMIDRSAYIGGCDSVANIAGAELLGTQAVGTMPHSLILIVGDVVKASKAFHEVMEKTVKRISLVDTFQDEKIESLRVAGALGKDLFAVRLDTPSSRRGDFLSILKEVRWELDIHGFKHVKLFVSGGIDEDAIRELNQVVDAYGVGTSISNAPVLDYAMDIVEIEGKAIAKRGKMSGGKQVYVNPRTGERLILPVPQKPTGRAFQPLLQPLLYHGKWKRELPNPQRIRSYVLAQIKQRSSGT